MRCGKCGFGLTVVNNNRGHNYVNCYGRKKHVCTGREHAWQLEEIESFAYHNMMYRLNELRCVKATSTDKQENQREIEIKNEIARLENRCSNLLDEIEIARESGLDSSIGVLRKRFDEYTRSIEQKHKALSALYNADNERKKNMNCGVSIETIIEQFNDFDMKTKQKIARSLIQHVIVNDQNVDVILH